MNIAITPLSRNREITIHGFSNIIKNGVLESACCLDCRGGQHGPNAIESLELQNGDRIMVSNKDNDNHNIMIVSEGMIFRVKELTVHFTKSK